MVSERARLPVLTHSTTRGQYGDSPSRRQGPLPERAQTSRPLVTILGSERDTTAFARALLRGQLDRRLALVVARPSDARAFEDLAGTVYAVLVIEDDAPSPPAGQEHARDTLRARIETLPADALLLGLGPALLERYTPTFAIGIGALGRGAAPPDLWLADASEPVALALGRALATHARGGSPAISKA